MSARTSSVVCSITGLRVVVFEVRLAAIGEKPWGPLAWGHFGDTRPGGWRPSQHLAVVPEVRT